MTVLLLVSGLATLIGGAVVGVSFRTLLSALAEESFRVHVCALAGIVIGSAFLVFGVTSGVILLHQL